MPGRHAAPAGPNFYRDLLTMIGGILVVAALVYLGLSALSSSNGPTTTSTATVTGSITSRSSTTVAGSTTTLRNTTTAAPTTTAVVLREPEEIRVQVLNAIGVAGLAGEVTRDLAALGYQTLTPGNYQPTLAQSRVWFASGFEGEAFALASEFPDALVEEASPDLAVNADIVVVLGQSYER